MSKIQTISLAQVSFNNIVKGKDRHELLGKSVKAFFDNSSFVEAEVEDTMPCKQNLLVMIKDLQNQNKFGEPKRRRAYLVKDGFAIILECDPLTGSLEAYSKFLEGFEEEVLPFKAGYTVSVSAPVVEMMEEFVKFTDEKTVSIRARLGKTISKKEEITFKEKLKGAVRTSKDTEGNLTLTVDEEFIKRGFKFAKVVVELTVDKIHGLLTLFNPDSIKAVLKKEVKALEKRDRELK